MGLICETRDRLHEFTKDRFRYLTRVEELNGATCPTRYPLRSLLWSRSSLKSLATRKTTHPILGWCPNDATAVSGFFIDGFYRSLIPLFSLLLSNRRRYHQYHDVSRSLLFPLLFSDNCAKISPIIIDIYFIAFRAYGNFEIRWLEIRLYVDVSIGWWQWAQHLFPPIVSH